MTQTLSTSVFWNRSVTLDELLAVAQGAPLHVDEAAYARLHEARQIVEEAMHGGRAVYGLNTGLGSLKKYVLDEAQLADFNRQVVRSHAIYLNGRALNRHEVRAMMATRVAGLLQGGSGVRPELLRLLVDMLNRGVHPVVRPITTSLGESDLAPLAQVALVMIGEGEAEYGGEVLPGTQALARAGLRPVTLAAKEGLGLISAQSYSVGMAVLALHQLEQVMDAFDVAAAYSLEGFDGNPSMLCPAVTEGRPLRGQFRRAERLRRLLEGSNLSTRARNLQDPLSFRCVVQVHGAADEALEFARSQTLALINAQTDNPVVDVARRRLVTSGNFDGTTLALASDTLRLALHRILVMSVQRVSKLVWASFSGLPTALAHPDDPELGMTLNNASRSMASIAARAHVLAQPCSLSITPNTTEGTDDYCSMAPNGVEMLGEQLGLASTIIALEVMFAHHALRLRPEARLSAPLERLRHHLASSLAPPLNVNTYIRTFDLTPLLRLAHSQGAP